MVFAKKSVLAVFYYLIAVDGAKTSAEMDTFYSIGKEMDSSLLDTYINEIASAYQYQLQAMIDNEDFYDVILEGVDKALMEPVPEDEECICSRHLLWDLLVIAYADGVYSYEERRFIKHIVRICEIEKDIFLEMEQLMKANVAVSNELETMSRSDKPYTEIRPIIDELENRRNVIVTSAKTLIEDEMYIPVDKMEIHKNKVIEDTKVAVGNVANNVADTVTPLASEIGSQTKKFFGNIKSRMGNKGTDNSVN